MINQLSNYHSSYLTSRNESIYRIPQRSMKSGKPIGHASQPLPIIYKYTKYDILIIRVILFRSI